MTLPIEYWIIVVSMIVLIVGMFIIVFWHGEDDGEA